MTSPKKSDAELLADALHRAMCYRGDQTPTCKYDIADGRLMLEELHKMGVVGLARRISDES